VKISKGESGSERVPHTQRYTLRALISGVFKIVEALQWLTSTAIHKAQKRTLQERSFRHKMVGRSHSQFIVSLIFYFYFHWAQHEILYIPPFELSQYSSINNH